MESTSIEQETNKNQTKAFIISFLIYALFLAALYFLKLVYTAPEETEGVELNYGIDLVGSGNIQTTNLANKSLNNEEVKSSESSESTTPIKNTPINNPKPVEKVEKIKETPTKPVITSKTESPIVEKETAKPVKKVETKPVVSPPANTKPKSTPKPEIVKPEEPKRNVETGSIMKKGTGGKGASTGAAGNGTIGTKDGIGGNNNGTGSKGEVGDQGDPRGTLDGKSMMGKPGSGGSSGASIGGLSGWNKGKLSLPNDGSSETGQIVFSVTVDDAGDVIAINVISSTVSPSVQNFYKKYIQQKLGSVLSPEGTPPARASGKITINIRSGN